MNPEKQITRDNHYVPQFYLKYWSGNGNTVRTFNGVVPNESVPYWNNAAIKKIACNRDFYTQVINGAEDDSFEKFLTDEYETPSKPIFDKVAKDQPITTRELDILVSFLAAQYVRTPAWYQWVTDTFKEAFHPTLKETVEKVEEAHKTGNLPTEPFHRFDGSLRNEGSMLDGIPLKITLDREKSAIEAKALASRALFLSSARRMLSTTAKTLHEHNWRILKTPAGVLLPTSDNPVIRLSYPNQHAYNLNGGLGKKNDNILLPLSPNHLLFTQIGSTKEELEEIELSADDYQFIIKLIIENATRYVFARKEIPEINTIRPRLVDPQSFENLKLAREEWHDKNVELENSFWRQI